MKKSGERRFRQFITRCWINSVFRVVFLVVFGVLFTRDCIASEKELIRDPGFSAGYSVVSPVREKYKQKPVIESIHYLRANSPEPSWRLVQWGSKKSIAGVTPQVVPDGPTSWSYIEHRDNQAIIYKKVSILHGYPMPDGSEYSSLTLELNGLAEFSAVNSPANSKSSSSLYLPSHDKQWPHLLMMQEIDSGILRDYHSLIMRFDARLLFDNKLIEQSGYNKNLHAARYLVGLLVRNALNGRSFWLMLPVYDDRHQESGFSCRKCTDFSLKNCRIATALDDPGVWSCGYDGSRSDSSFGDYPAEAKPGSKHLIFRIPTRAFTDGELHEKWRHHEIDLMPYLAAAISAHGQDDIHQRDHKTSMVDPMMFYNITLVTIGWEITGLNHAAIELKNLSLKGIE